MRTFSHAIMTAALGKKTELKRADLVAFLIGSIVPDIPLFVLTSLSMLTSPSQVIGMERMHLNYATNPLWISLHNTPHSLVVLGLLAAIGLLLYPKRWAKLLLWLAAGATLHTAIDIFTHAGDGPFFLFPLSWTIRFNSPVSYWDTKHFGGIFTIIEYSLDALLLLYLSISFIAKRFGFNR